ncbi:MAG: EamA family transporter [Planctomycetia bacterium]|nr:EamA family transporter [Planctomycetia bacterium]
MPILSDSTRGRLFVVAAALLWSSNGLFVKNTLFADWPHEQRGLLLAFWRALFAALVLLPLVRTPRLSIKLLPMLIVFFAMSVTFLQSMVWTTTANAIWLQNIAPLWVCIFARLSGETLDRRDLTTLVFSVAGVSLILVCELSGTDWSGTAPRGVLLGFLSGLFYAGVIYFLRKLRHYDPAWLIVVNLTTTAVLLSPTPWQTGIWPSGNQWLGLIAFGGLQMGAAYFCFARGMRTISGQEGSGIGLLEPILGPIWVWLCFQERPAWWTIAGGALIFCGLSWRYLTPLVLKRAPITPAPR